MTIGKSWEDWPLILGTEEAAKLIGSNTARIRELCKAGIIPNVRLGRAYRIPREALRTWLLNQAENCPASGSRANVR